MLNVCKPHAQYSAEATRTANDAAWSNYYVSHATSYAPRKTENQYKMNVKRTRLTVVR